LIVATVMIGERAALPGDNDHEREFLALKSRNYLRKLSR
jgi:hypothetical protein